MRTKQTVAIIGATGKMGSAIAKGLTSGNYRILLCATDAEKNQSLYNDIIKQNASADIEALNCSMQASWEADIIILAVPYALEKDIVENIREVANQKILVSISNPLNSTYSELTTSTNSSAAEELQKLLPNTKVVKAFNTTFAGDFSHSIINGQQIDSFIVGNNEEAVQTVSEMVQTVGFNPVIAGDLSVSRTLEAMQLLLIQMTMKNNYPEWVAGWKILHN